MAGVPSPVAETGSASPERPRATASDPLGAVRRIVARWRLILLCALVGMFGGWLMAEMAADTDAIPIEIDHYEAAHVLVLDSNIPETQAVLGVRNLNVLAKRITIGAVPRAVAEATGLPASDVAGQIRVLIRSDSESVDLVAIGETPAEAEILADAYAEAIIADLEAEAAEYAAEAIASAEARLTEAEANLADVRREIIDVERRGDERAVAFLEQDEQQYLSARIYANAALLDARADGVPIVPLDTLEFAAGTASVISESRFDGLVAKAAVGQNITLLFGDEQETETGGGALAAVSSRLPSGAGPRLLFGALAGLVLGIAAAAALDRVDTKVRSKRQVESVLDLPVIAEVPTLPQRARRTAEIHSREHPRSRFAEQYRTLASTVLYARRRRPDRTSQVVLVTSPGPAEGKTTTVANLGAMLAESGRTVLLMNCDFRRPRLHLLTGARYQPMDLHETDIPDVELISNVIEDDAASPTEVIAAQRTVIQQAAALYDIVLLDTAPVLATNDAMDLLDLVDDVVLVCRAGRTRVLAADRAVETIERREAHVLGVTITDLDLTRTVEYYGYGSYYDERPARRVNWIQRWRARRARPDIDLPGARHVDVREPVASGERIDLAEVDFGEDDTRGQGVGVGTDGEPRVDDVA